MGKIYVGQTALRIEATCGVDITGATTHTIMYKKPSGTTGTWASDILNAEEGSVFYEPVNNSDIDEIGTWILYMHVVFSDGREAYGEPYNFKVHEIGH